MKQLLILCTALLFFVGSFAQFRSIPSAVTNSFKEKYPAAADVKWDDKVTSFQGKFLLDSASYEARFDRHGVWQETERAITYEQLPEAVKQSFEASKYFKKFGVRATAEIEKSNGGKEFRIFIRNNWMMRKFVYYDADGKFLHDALKI